MWLEDAFEDYSGRGPSVVAENAAGEKRVVAVTKKLQEAKDKAVLIENDFKTLGAAAWCERYDVPPSFVVRLIVVSITASASAGGRPCGRQDDAQAFPSAVNSARPLETPMAARSRRNPAWASSTCPSPGRGGRAKPV